MTEDEFLYYMEERGRDNPLPRFLMSAEERRFAARLAKQGKLVRGISDDRQKSVIFYAEQEAPPCCTK